MKPEYDCRHYKTIVKLICKNWNICTWPPVQARIQLGRPEAHREWDGTLLARMRRPGMLKLEWTGGVDECIVPVQKLKFSPDAAVNFNDASLFSTYSRIVKLKWKHQPKHIFVNYCLYFLQILTLKPFWLWLSAVSLKYLLNILVLSEK